MQQLYYSEIHQYDKGGRQGTLWKPGYYRMYTVCLLEGVLKDKCVHDEAPISRRIQQDTWIIKEARDFHYANEICMHHCAQISDAGQFIV